MAYSLNRAQIIGNLTRDPEIRVTPADQKVVSFGVATNFRWTDQTGQLKEKTEFHNVVAWRKLAELCERYLRKGRKVYIEGRLQTREWEGEDGIKRNRTEIIADNVIFLDRAGGEAEVSDKIESFTHTQTPQKGALKPPEKSKADQGVQEEVNLEDLPF